MFFLWLLSLMIVNCDINLKLASLDIIMIILFLSIWFFTIIDKVVQSCKRSEKRKKTVSESFPIEKKKIEEEEFNKNIPVPMNNSVIVVPIKQRSEEWLEWRLNGIGSSDIPAILGESPWATPYEVWLIKTRKKNEGPPTVPMIKGIILEPEARKAYIKKTGINVKPCCLQSLQKPWMRASLDGLSLDGKIVLEIKIPGRKDHDIAKNGKIPSKYIPQCDYLLAISGAEILHYWSYHEGTGVLIEHHRNAQRIYRILSIAEEFWGYVIRNEPPPDGFPLRRKKK